jgi:hypothetical protein
VGLVAEHNGRAIRSVRDAEPFSPPAASTTTSECGGASNIQLSATDGRRAVRTRLVTGPQLGLGVGGQLESMDQAWWTPTLRVPDEPVAWPIIFEEAPPGSILVDRGGRRSTNEAASCSDVVLGMFAAGARSAYLVLDARFRAEYPCGPVLPGRIQPDWSTPAPAMTFGYIAARTVAAARG